MAHKDDPNAGGLNPALLAHVVADREARPWNYYRLDHDVMKRMLNQQRDTLDHLQAENTQLRAAALNDTTPSRADVQGSRRTEAATATPPASGTRPG